MKKLLAIIAIVLFSVSSAMALPFDKYTIDRSQLPETARKFLDDYFPKNKVGMIKIDKHLLKKPDYEVRLTNGTTIDFDKNGKWKEVDCQSRQVPDGIIPKAILRSVKKNFPDNFIVSIEKNRKGYEVELNDNVDLKFDLLGTYKGVKIED